MVLLLLPHNSFLTTPTLALQKDDSRSGPISSQPTQHQINKTIKYNHTLKLLSSPSNTHFASRSTRSRVVCLQATVVCLAHQHHFTTPKHIRQSHQTTQIKHQHNGRNPQKVGHCRRRSVRYILANAARMNANPLRSCGKTCLLM